MQHNIIDNQDLFCFVLILRMASRDTLFLFSVEQEAWLCSYVLCQIQGFCTYKKESTLLFLQFYQSFSISYIEIVAVSIWAPCFEPNLCSLILIPSKETVWCKILFPPCPQNVELKQGTLFVSIYRIRKLFFSWSQSNSKIALVKTKALLYIMVAIIMVTMTTASKGWGNIQ